MRFPCAHLALQTPRSGTVLAEQERQGGSPGLSLLSPEGEQGLPWVQSGTRVGLRGQ